MRPLALVFLASIVVSAAGSTGGCSADRTESTPAEVGGSAGEGGESLGGGGGGGMGGEGAACNDCHGSEDNPAPPRDVEGNVDESFPTVGAHQSHLGASGWHGPIACDQCHVVPTEPGEDPDVPTHMNDETDIVWGPLAQQGVYDFETNDCTDSYCHGGTLGPDIAGRVTVRAPVWTELSGDQKACGAACHTVPPGGEHTVVTACELCHAPVISRFDRDDPSSSTWTDASLHIDGVVQMGDFTCTSCHGDEGSGAVNPPRGTAGEMQTTEPAVGAHEAHLATGSTWHRDVACTDCHPLPSDVLHADARTDFDWSLPANSDGTDPAYDKDTNTCGDVFCHGASLAGPKTGGTINRTPSWIVVDGTYDACGTTCHTNPPGGYHPILEDCSICHGDVVGDYDSDNPELTTFVDPSLHINGVVNVTWPDCTTCHGDASTGEIAPPLGTNGETETFEPAVGAHREHLQDSDWHRDVRCTDCHIFPASVTHSSGQVDFDWTGIADDDGAVPLYAAYSCTGIYCHGATLKGPNGGGSVNREPEWTVVDGTYDGCGTTCHTNPPGDGHASNSQCELCHGAVISSYDVADPDASTWQDPDLHINGTVEVSATSCDGCHGAPPATGAHLVHFGALASDASYGGTGVTADIQPAGNVYAMDCGNCHPIDAANHMNGVPNAGGGTAEIDLSPSGAPANSLKARNAPTASYTPGGTVLIDANGMSYTEGTCSEVYCHSDNTITSGDVPVPGVDFTPSGYPTVYPPYTVNVTRTYTSVAWGDTLSCDGCHGFPPRTTYPDVIAGVGDSHSYIDSWGYENLHGFQHNGDPMPCAGCHFSTVVDPGVRSKVSGISVYQPVAIDDKSAHVNGAVDVGFTTDLVTVMSTGFDLSGVSYDPPTRTCSSVPCHLAQTDVSWGSPYRWENSWECNTCHQY